LASGRAAGAISGLKYWTDSQPHEKFLTVSLSMKILTTIQEAQREFDSCVATIGKYDGMHLGHQKILDELLNQARMLSLPSVVILSEPQPDEFFSKGNGAPRLNHFQDKVDFLDEYGIDGVYRLKFDYELSQQTPDDFVRNFLVAGLGIKRLIIGDDFRFGVNRSGSRALLEKMSSELDYQVVSISPCLNGGERVSSTLVKQYLHAGDCERVRELLGRPYSISGRIIKGRQLGRLLGTPTANLELLTKGLPMTGIFTVVAKVRGTEFKGAANVGYNPTVDDTLTPSIEVHLLDFNEDIYGEVMQVSFIRKLRNEEKFANLEELKTQIALDLEQTRKFFATNAHV
jgi:riboflavin kinase / FMN adenylyltransferase